MSVFWISNEKEEEKKEKKSSSDDIFTTRYCHVQKWSKYKYIAWPYPTIHFVLSPRTIPLFYSIILLFENKKQSFNSLHDRIP